MISLVLRKKVPLTEDALTAAVFDYLRHQADAAQLQELLRPACFLGSDSLPMEFDAYELHMWPPDHRAGEPDGLLILKDEHHTVCRIVMEAKLGAPKSGTGDVADDRRTGDQLARYLLAEAEDNPETAVYLLYITHHLACPTKDLQESSHFLQRAGRPELAKRLLWLPWHAIATLLAAQTPSAAVTDLRTLLSQAVLHRFERFELHPLPPTSLPTFYNEGYRPARQPALYPGPGKVRHLPLGAFTWSYRRQRARAYQWCAPVGLLARADFFQRGSQ